MEKIFIIFLALLAFSAAERVYPCALTDLSCMRGVLAAHSTCDQAVPGSISSPVFYEKTEYVAAYFNSTFHDHHIEYKNIDKCNVSTFFINTDTETLVIALTCPNLGYSTHRNVIYHKPQEESLENDYRLLNGTYPLIISTANLRLNKDIDICSSFIFAYVTELPVWEVKCATEESTKITNNILAHTDVIAREEGMYLGSLAFRVWVNSMLCNFNNNCSSK